MSWSTLPIELTTRILTFSEPTELVNFRRVNNFFKSLIDESTTFQYRIALFASGMVDGPPGNLTTSERLELLRRYEASWKNIEWSEHHIIPYPQGRTCEFNGNVRGHNTRGNDAIDFIQLPSRLRGISLRQWTLRFDFDVQHFSMDPSQDLLVAIEYPNHVANLCRIHLCTLSTGEKHPLAGSTAAIEYTPAVSANTQGHPWISTIRVCGGHVAILFLESLYQPERRNELVVWSWRTGVQKLAVLSADVKSFVFLDDNFILASTWAPPALLVYSLEQRADDDTTQDRTHVLRFLFGPRFQDPHWPGFSEILIKSDPSPGGLPSTRQVPFQVAGDERMIALYSPYFDSVNSRTFLIPMKSFLGQIKNLLVKEGLDVDWELQGPGFVEHLPVCNEWDTWAPFVFGMRYITPRVRPFGKPMIVIRDLCQRRCLKASKEERDESDVIYKEMTWGRCRDTAPYPRGILKRVSLPESIDLYPNATLFISEDNIVVIEDAHINGGDADLHLLTI